MKKLKISIFLIILGNILYITYISFTSSKTPVADFLSGLLLGISIATNLLGIILTAKYINAENKKGDK